MVMDRAAISWVDSGISSHSSLSPRGSKSVVTPKIYDYDQTLMPGPPFSISNKEIHQHYGDSCNLNLISNENVVGGLKGKCTPQENVWLLHKP